MLLDHCVEHYSKALTGEISAISVLYPDGGKGYFKEYNENTVVHSNAPNNIILIVNAILDIIKKTKKKLRILEVGGGDGGLTWPLVSALKGVDIEYSFTDVGPTFVHKAQKRALQQGIDFMEFRTFDISEDPEDQDFKKYNYDIILGYNVVHATKNINDSINNLKMMLKPNGYLIIQEPIKELRWIDMIWGLAEGWWYFEDDDLRTYSPLLNIEKWERVLQNQLFTDINIYPKEAEERKKVDNALIIARQQDNIKTKDFIDWSEKQTRMEYIKITDKIHDLMEIEKSGGDIRYIETDLTDNNQMEMLIDSSIKSYGEINGIIHGAMLYRDDFSLKDFQEIRYEQNEQQFIRSVYGLYDLEKKLHETDIDFCMLLSYGTSLNRQKNQMVYSAVNSFVDAFVQDRNKSSNFQWINVNSPLWADSISAEAEHNDDNTSIGATKENYNPLIKVLASSTSGQVILSPIDQSQNVKEVIQHTDEDIDTYYVPDSHARPSLNAEYIAPRSNTEWKIALIWQELLGIDRIGIDDNFFELGGDSLLHIQINDQINDFFNKEIPIDILYESPTIANMAKYIDSSYNTITPVLLDDPISLAKEAVFPKDFPSIQGSYNINCSDPKGIFITGITGYIGSFLSSGLLETTNANLYCLVRSNDKKTASKRIEQSLKRYNIWNEKCETRIIPVLGDLGKPRFGLDNALFKQLALQTDIIYHVGAYVNHVMPYNVLKNPNVDGTIEVLRLAALEKIKSVHFFSTIATIAPHNFLPDENTNIDNLIHMKSRGYSGSKWVAEKIILMAKNRGLPCKIYRLGQVSGHSLTGVCRVDDFIHNFLLSIITLGCFPKDLYNRKIDLAPIDYIAKAVLFLSQEKSIGDIFHLMSPYRIKYRNIIDELEKINIKIELMDFSSWKERIELFIEDNPGSSFYLLPPYVERLISSFSLYRLVFDEMTRIRCKKTVQQLFARGISCPKPDTFLLEKYLTYLIKESKAKKYYRLNINFIDPIKK